MRRFHTATPWFGESRAVLCEEIHVPLPMVGESIVLSGGRIVTIVSLSPPVQHRDGYRGKIYWTVTLDVRLDA